MSQLIVNTSSFYNVTNYYYNYTTNYNHLYAKRREGEGGGGRREGERDIRGPKNVCLMLLMFCPLTRGQPLVLEPPIEQPIVTLSYGERERERERGREEWRERETKT